MGESVRGGLDHPAKGSWSERASWNTEKGSVGHGVNGAHGRPETFPFCWNINLNKCHFQEAGIRKLAGTKIQSWEFSCLCGAADQQQHILHNKSC